MKNNWKQIFEGEYLDTWTPNWQRVDDIASKIEDAEKAKAEKRVPIGSEAN